MNADVCIYIRKCFENGGVCMRLSGSLKSYVRCCECERAHGFVLGIKNVHESGSEINKLSETKDLLCGKVAVPW